MTHTQVHSLYLVFISFLLFQSFGGQYSRKQSESEAHSHRGMERLTQPTRQEEDRQLPCGSEKCRQYLLVQRGHSGRHTQVDTCTA